MESRRLPGQRFGPLRGLPFAAQPDGRGEGRCVVPRRWDGRWLGGAGVERVIEGTDAVDRGSALRLFEHRLFRRTRRGDRADGAGGLGTGEVTDGGYSGDGGVPGVTQWCAG